MAHNSYPLDPGPLDGSILSGQLTHRSRDIWEGQDNIILNPRKSDGGFWNVVKKHPIHRRVVDVIIRAGLYGVYRSYRPTIDRSLITSLVERWRPETHTFHFRNGEATITLQDIEVLYGLRVDGEPVIGNEHSREKEEWRDICTRLLGFTPTDDDIKHNTLKVTALNTFMQDHPTLLEGATEEDVNQKARCYMFLLISGMMMAGTSSGSLRLAYLPMLENVDAISAYSWGSATLACLYRNLCAASQSGRLEIAGFLPLLQIWAWERITVLRPQVVAQKKTEDFFSSDLPRGPRATCWIAHFSWTDTSQYVLSVYRDALDSMKDDQFIWRPYSDELIESLPESCRAGRHLWRARVPLICWEVVESHFPDRVMRQFGMPQHIPETPMFDSKHFTHGLRGNQNKNWFEENAQYLLLWNQRQDFVFEPPVESLQTTDSYFDWFRRITRTLIGNYSRNAQREQGYVPNSTPYEAMARYIHSMVDKARSYGDHPTVDQLIAFHAEVRDEGSRCLEYVDEAARLQVPANYSRSGIPVENLHPQVPMRGLGGVSGRRSREIASGRVGGGAIRPRNRRTSDSHVPDCEDASSSGVSNEDVTQPSGCNDHADDYDIGSMSAMNTQNVLQLSNISCQSPGTQIVPFTTPHTPQYSFNPTFESDYGRFPNDSFDQATRHFRTTPLPLSIEFPDVVGDGDVGDRDSNTDLEDSTEERDDTNLEGAIDEGDITQIEARPQRKKYLKRCGTGGHFVVQHRRGTKRK